MATMPPSVWTSYKSYKTDEKRLARWILARAEQLDITSVGDDIPVPPASAASSKSSKKKVGKGKPKEEAPPSLPTDLKAWEMAKLVVKISSRTVQKCPVDVISIVESVINLRKEVSDFYENLALAALRQSYKTHAHWLKTLRDVHRLLLDCPSHKLDGQLTSTRFAAGSYMDLLGLEDGESSTSPSSTASSAESTIDEDWLPDHIKGKSKSKSKSKPSVPMHERPLLEFKLVSDFDQDGDEAEVAAWFLFRDLQQMREYVQDTWASCAEGRTTLVTASFVSTQALEIVKDMETEFFTTFASHFGSQKSYAAVIATMFKFPRLQVPLGQLTEFLEDLPPKSEAMVMASTWTLLWKYGANIVKGSTPSPKPGFFDEFNPNADTSGWTAEMREREEVCLLATHFAEVQLQAQLSGSGYEGPSRKRETVDEMALVHDFRTFIDDRTHSVPIHLVFQWQMWKDHVLINRHRLHHYLDQVHDVARNIVDASRRWLHDGFRPALYTDNNVGQAKIMVETYLVEQLPRLVLHDPNGEWKRKNSPRVPIVPFRAFLYNPWACGVAIMKILALAHDISTTIINGTGLFTSTLQLYDALLQHEMIERWPVLDHLLDIAAPTMYYAGRPTIGKFLLAHDIANGGDPTRMCGQSFPSYRNTGHGTGALSIEGPWIARVVEQQKYKLTNDDIVQLFPSSADANQVAKYDPRTRTQQAGPRFGSKRCDPYTLLRALKDRVEVEFKNTGMGVDFFTVQLFSTYVLREWNRRAESLFIEFYGPEYMERQSQVSFLVGYLFMALEHREKARECGRNISEASVEKMFAEAAATLTKARADAERGIAMGGVISYFGSRDHGAFWDDFR